MISKNTMRLSRMESEERGAAIEFHQELKDLRKHRRNVT